MDSGLGQGCLGLDSPTRKLACPDGGELYPQDFEEDCDGARGKEARPGGSRLRLGPGCDQEKLAYPRDGESDQDDEDLEVFDGQDVGGGVGSGIVLEGGVGLGVALELVKKHSLAWMAASAIPFDWGWTLEGA